MGVSCVPQKRSEWIKTSTMCRLIFFLLKKKSNSFSENNLILILLIVIVDSIIEWMFVQTPSAAQPSKRWEQTHHIKYRNRTNPRIQQWINWETKDQILCEDLRMVTMKTREEVGTRSGLHKLSNYFNSFICQDSGTI